MFLGTAGTGDGSNGDEEPSLVISETQLVVKSKNRDSNTNNGRLESNRFDTEK